MTKPYCSSKLGNYFTTGHKKKNYNVKCIYHLLCKSRHQPFQVVCVTAFIKATGIATHFMGKEISYSEVCKRSHIVIIVSSLTVSPQCYL